MVTSCVYCSLGRDEAVAAGDQEGIILSDSTETSLAWPCEGGDVVGR